VSIMECESCGEMLDTDYVEFSEYEVCLDCSPEEGWIIYYFKRDVPTEGWDWSFYHEDKIKGKSGYAASYIEAIQAIYKWEGENA